IPGNYWEKHLLRAVLTYCQIIRRLEVPPPIVLMLSVLSVRGNTMYLPWGYREGHPIDRDNLVMPKILLELFEFDPAQVMRPAFDTLWNAAGLPQSISYDEQGKWKETGFDDISCHWSGFPRLEFLCGADYWPSPSQPCLVSS